jgi:hypothetical protein
MDQLHRRFSVEQVRLLYKRYNEGQMTRPEVLGIGKTRFFASRGRCPQAGGM